VTHAVGEGCLATDVNIVVCVDLARGRTYMVLVGSLVADVSMLYGDRLASFLCKTYTLLVDN
jgi:hypothetical protein